ncbi:AfsR/SARP family transcriptional regulator [Streptomyces hoynatensis]|uniref:OmpR/PhoB-type domain-containing protein n=1 Tax=Streptomyces hoynatensis TaxID=1141874 RepID=A0A3A9YX29_9ACTN|nr:BTAD domain-containing putative transcriptional regulator [Streptomyces hoynatensis]RKN40430.1 hypothetical protein D7294_18455 [Streptomyces hoynatensis]
MRFRLLGPLEVAAGDIPVRIAADRQRTVLAMLLANAGQVVPVRSLVAEVWGEAAPPSAVSNLRTYVMRLRRLLPPGAQAPDARRSAGRITTSPSGYLLCPGQGEFDLHAFRQAHREGLAARAEGDLAAAEAALSAALALWRGEPAADVRHGPTLAAWAADLAEQYASAVENLADVQLARGAHAAAVPRLRPLLDRFPLRERPYEQLMLALYRCGDAPGALAVFGRAHRALAEGPGLTPGPGLARLRQAVLRRDAALTGPPPGRPRGRAVRPAGRQDARAPREPAPRAPQAPPRRELPRLPVHFVGRSAELAWLRAALRPAGGPRLTVLHGPAGVGKSALALRAAHAAADEYRAEAACHVDLQGAGDGARPLPAAEALGRLLRALGVPGERVPAAPAEAAARYQSLLAERRVLLLLDNAACPAQVLPLLPARGECAVLVTSREPLTGLDAARLALPALRPGESLGLLELAAGRRFAEAERAAAQNLARRYGHDPAALRLAGAWLAAAPGRTPESLHRRLDAPAPAEPGRAPAEAASACLALLRAGLPEDRAAARLLRLLGALPVPECTTGLAAALLGADAGAAAAALRALAAARLIEPVGDARYRPPGPLRGALARLAAELPAAEREKTLIRALDWYLDSGRAVVGAPGRAGRGPGQEAGGQGQEEFRAAQAGGARWLDAELPCLLAAAGLAAEGPAEQARCLPGLLALVRAPAMREGRWAELEALTALALRAAAGHGDAAGEALTLLVAADLDARAGRHEAARAALRRALALSRERGDGEGEARALHALGRLCLRLAEPARALDHLTAALALLDERTHLATVRRCRRHQGEALLQLGRYAEAVHCFRRALGPDRGPAGRGEGATLAALGRAYHLLGQEDLALATFRTALERCRAAGDGEAEWGVLLCRSVISLRRGDPAAAIADLTRARELAGRTGQPYGQAAAARQLARALSAAGNHAAASSCAERAAQLFAAPALRRDPVLERVLAAPL